MNLKLARLIGVPYIGCASHRLNLAVKKWTESVHYASLIEQVQNLMISLKTAKNLSILRKHTRIKPEIRNVTRWSSTWSMLDKFLSIQKLPKEEYDTATLNLFPNVAATEEIKKLTIELSYLNKLSIAIQSDTKNLAAIRLILDRTPHSSSHF